MADKSFGVKDINLIGASGTPEIESPNNLNIKAVNVAISTDMSVGGELTVTDTFLKPQAVGLGTTTATGRDAGISTATGTIIYIPTVGMQVYAGDDGWKTIADTASSGGAFVATGGTKTTVGSYTVHTFLSTGPFEIQSGSRSVDVLIVGGGGGGGWSHGGGGGAGGFRTHAFTAVVGDITVQVGGGADGGVSNPPSQGLTGTPSYFGTSPQQVNIESAGGGGGGSYNGTGSGNNGGSGGGGGGGSPGAGGAGNTPSTPTSQGNPGGDSPGGTAHGSGGGGAGGAGENATGGGPGSGPGGGGGNGNPNDFRTGSSVIYGGGGGGGTWGTVSPRAGGTGGGGAGAAENGTGGDATDNTGGGGGGGGAGSPSRGGNGGSGIVVVRYLT